MRYRSFVYDSSRWAAYRHRPGDIVITTPPKSGTTWVQNIVAMLVLGTTEIGRPIASISPWLDQLLRPIDEVIADLEAMPHRRFIKSHTPIDGLPWHEDVTYLSVLRDPRDAAVSWDHHFANLDHERVVALRASAHGLDDLAEVPIKSPSDDPVERWWAYMTDRDATGEFPAGLELIARHATAAWDRRLEPNVVLVHYADLQRDLDGEVRRIAKRLDVDVAETRWRDLVEAASFTSMRARAGLAVPNAGQIWRDQEAFFHRGTSGQWRDLVGDGADERYQRIVRDLLHDEELLSWLHRP
ncbi:MAG TPA: sulfotransferase domain-containing protein [Acidimicrobiales bacterium]|nr:sulfotransferase domain-containing protein [Acidimicrobiales bacterium]